MDQAIISEAADAADFTGKRGCGGQSPPERKQFELLFACSSNPGAALFSLSLLRRVNQTVGLAGLGDGYITSYGTLF